MAFFFLSSNFLDFFPPFFIPLSPYGKEWAIVSGKYNEGLFNPSKWKINFRCALKSTKRFHLVTKSKDPDSDPAPYHVYEIVPLNCMGAANLPASTGKATGIQNWNLHELYIGW